MKSQPLKFDSSNHLFSEDIKSVKIFGYKSVWMKFFICLFYKDLLNWGFLDNKDCCLIVVKGFLCVNTCFVLFFNVYLYIYLPSLPPLFFSCYCCWFIFIYLFLGHAMWHEGAQFPGPGTELVPTALRGQNLKHCTIRKVPH